MTTPTDADNFRVDANYRLVAAFPLSGRLSDAYTIWIVNEGPSELYAVCDHYGFNFGATRTMHEALNLCLRNTGWAVRAHRATEKELSR